MSIDYNQIAKDYWDQQPHPREPSLKISEFATAIKLATHVKFGGHASPAEAGLFWKEFAPGGVPIMSPQEFEHAVDRIAPLSYAFHGRPPSMQEIVKLKDEHPKNVHSYFAELPDKHFPHVSAGNMVKALESAKPHAREHLGREPVKSEASYLHHSGEHPADYYSRLAAAEPTIPEGDNVLPIKERGNPAGRSSGTVG